MRKRNLANFARWNFGGATLLPAGSRSTFRPPSPAFSGEFVSQFVGQLWRFSNGPGSGGAGGRSLRGGNNADWMFTAISLLFYRLGSPVEIEWRR